MDFYLQFGYGMMAHSEQLIRQWGGGTVILSPRDLEPEQIPPFSSRIRRSGGKCLIDPQFYEPRANWARLNRHSYWPNDYETNLMVEGSTSDDMLLALRDLNTTAQTPAFIAPGLYATEVNQDWLDMQSLMLQKSAHYIGNKPRIATICISSDVLRSREQVDELLDNAESWDVAGYYLVGEHPANQYLVTDPVWLANFMLLAAGLRLHGRRVISGYSTQQLLALGAANIDAIASGTWLNVRSFSTDRFIYADEEQQKTRATWYYCPHSLSEYKPRFLDMAHRSGILQELKPCAELDGGYAEVLFTGIEPSVTAFGESQAFRHYLFALSRQTAKARRGKFKDTMDHHRRVLEEARKRISRFRGRGVMGETRDFNECIDVNLAALASLESEVGFVISRRWEQV